MLYVGRAGLVMKASDYSHQEAADFSTSELQASSQSSAAFPKGLFLQQVCCTNQAEEFAIVSLTREETSYRPRARVESSRRKSIHVYFNIFGSCIRAMIAYRVQQILPFSNGLGRR